MKNQVTFYFNQKLRLKLLKFLSLIGRIKLLKFVCKLRFFLT